MSPSCRRRTRSTRKSSSKRRTFFKKPIQSSKSDRENPAVSPVKSPVNPCNNTSDAEGPKDVDNKGISCDNINACSTPKAERFRIPEIKTCPPAPRKRRVVASCSLRRTSVTFFAPPDIELFFYCALRGVPV